MESGAFPKSHAVYRIMAFLTVPTGFRPLFYLPAGLRSGFRC